MNWLTLKVPGPHPPHHRRSLEGRAQAFPYREEDPSLLPLPQNAAQAPLAASGLLQQANTMAPNKQNQQLNGVPPHQLVTSHLIPTQGTEPDPPRRRGSCHHAYSAGGSAQRGPRLGQPQHKGNLRWLLTGTLRRPPEGVPFSARVKNHRSLVRVQNPPR